MEMIKYLKNFFIGGELKYKAGEIYPKSAETELHVVQGHAETVEAMVDKAEEAVIDIETATVKEIKAFLDKLGVEFAQNAKAEDLRELAKNAAPVTPSGNQ